MMSSDRDAPEARELYEHMRLTYSWLSSEEFDTLFNGSLSLPYGEASFSRELVSRSSREKLLKNFLRRSSGTAVEYITGTADFMGFTFEMAEGVFIPKNSTEILVEKVLERSSPGMKLLDEGCGCGNIALCAAKLGNLSVTACDINSAAVNLTRKNAEMLGADINVLQSNLFSGIEGTFDIIASNPPYIREGAALDKAVLSQPMEALFSGPDGLNCIRNIAGSARAYMNAGGRLFLEMGEGQQAHVEKILFNNGWKNINFYKDLSGLMRVAEASC
ncbi:peptide chain release factor N(5)-glutamine methyltransferase [bacterium]|nr:peptide chain release factor N(5)-glutamine methyltransferase [bacterium]MBU3955961.1 peptide chain release factor N(5)-glutamine methyltransferase [bacterium]